MKNGHVSQRASLYNPVAVTFSAATVVLLCSVPVCVRRCCMRERWSYRPRANDLRPLATPLGRADE
ncbi:hypothetical protein D9M68_184890 [compost metagenome]